ncbi:MAG: S-(hydroxymethyl)glutathione synthase [Pseudomonadota bacterium]
MAAASSLHPDVDNGLTKGNESFRGGTLVCHCATDAVEVVVASQVAHNHLSGCTTSWRPPGALFSMVAMVARDDVTVTKNGDKLAVVDPEAAIQRYACKACGVHMLGRIEEENHPFFGLDFVHTELSGETGWQAPQFAGYVSSIIEAGTDPDDMPTIRQRLRDLGLEPYDCLSPALMDAIAIHNANTAAAAQ